jgi:hypothetical protein
MESASDKVATAVALPPLTIQLYYETGLCDNGCEMNRLFKRNIS